MTHNENYINAKKYAKKLGDKNRSLNLNEFFDKIHSKFYEDIDIEFMNYFLELLESDGFCIHQVLDL